MVVNRLLMRKLLVKAVLLHWSMRGWNQQVLHFHERVILKLREEGRHTSLDTGLQRDLGQVTLRCLPI